MERETFYVCGYSVETTLIQNDKDVSALYDDFFCNGKEEVLLKLNEGKKGYYGLSWYTQGHEKYCYLLGMEVGRVITVPEKAVLKRVPKALYARACFSQGEDIIEAWNEFFYTEIPKAGFQVQKEYNLFFEYYPENVQREFELWVPVVNASNT
jgi:Uncharacterized protein conserved in bacteria